MVFGYSIFRFETWDGFGLFLKSINKGPLDARREPQVYNKEVGFFKALSFSNQVSFWYLIN